MQWRLSGGLKAPRGGCAELQELGAQGFAEGVLVERTLDMLQGNLENFHRDARRETRIYDEVAPTHGLQGQDSASL